MINAVGDLEQAEPQGGAKEVTREAFRARLRGTLALDPSAYREIAQARPASRQALLIVVSVTLVTALGAGGQLALSLLVGWALGVGAVWLASRASVLESVSLGSTVAVLGFASATQVLLLFAIVPILGSLLGIAALVWGLLAYVAASRAILETSIPRAACVAVGAFAIKVLFGHAALSLGRILGAAT